jgi:hypothetical protein
MMEGNLDREREQAAMLAAVNEERSRLAKAPVSLQDVAKEADLRSKGGVASENRYGRRILRGPLDALPCLRCVRPIERMANRFLDWPRSPRVRTLLVVRRLAASETSCCRVCRACKRGIGTTRSVDIISVPATPSTQLGQWLSRREGSRLASIDRRAHFGYVCSKYLKTLGRIARSRSGSVM